jgi:hypothetical protein
VASLSAILRAKATRRFDSASTAINSFGVTRAASCRCAMSISARASKGFTM